MPFRLTQTPSMKLAMQSHKLYRCPRKSNENEWTIVSKLSGNLTSSIGESYCLIDYVKLKSFRKMKCHERYAKRLRKQFLMHTKLVKSGYFSLITMAR